MKIKTIPLIVLITAIFALSAFATTKPVRAVAVPDADTASVAANQTAQAFTISPEMAALTVRVSSVVTATLPTRKDKPDFKSAELKSIPNFKRVFLDRHKRPPSVDVPFVPETRRVLLC